MVMLVSRWFSRRWRVCLVVTASVSLVSGIVLVFSGHPVLGRLGYYFGALGLLAWGLFK